MGDSGSSTQRTWIVEWSHSQGVKWYPIEVVDSGILYFTESEARDFLVKEQSKFPLVKHRMRNTAPSPIKTDMKEGLTGGKPMLSELPYAALVYAARGFEYGHSPGKYERGNYLRPTVDVLADFHRMQFYLDAVLRHVTKLTTEMNRALGCGDKTEAELKAAAMTMDVESGLSHLTGMLANGMMAVQQAVDAGLICADPGQPWLKNKKN